MKFSTGLETAKHFLLLEFELEIPLQVQVLSIVLQLGTLFLEHLEGSAYRAAVSHWGETFKVTCDP